MNKKLIIPLIVILIAMIGIAVFYINSQQSIVFDKNTKSDCSDKRLDKIADGRICSNCIQWTERQFDCAIDNVLEHVGEDNRALFKESDREDLIDEKEWATVCYWEYDLNPNDNRFEPSTWMILECLKDSNYDYNDFCKSDSECDGVCINNECSASGGGNGGGNGGGGNGGGNDEPFIPSTTIIIISIVLLLIGSLVVIWKFL